MTLRTVSSLIGVANGAKNLHAMAADFFVTYRRYANGVNEVTIPNEPFVVVASGVGGTAEHPRISFALVWTERVTWQVADYLSPDDDAFQEGFGADNTCGHHIESEERNRQQIITITASHLLMPSPDRIAMIKKWKADFEAERNERARQEQIAKLEKQLNELKA